MLVKSAFTAALAATAHAFIIVPEFSGTDNTFADVSPLDASENTRSVAIDCPGCPFSIVSPDGSESPVLADVQTHLEMTFSIDPSAGGDRLLVNGFELYPNPDPFTGSLLAPQVMEGPEAGLWAAQGMKGNERSLGYRLQVYPLAKDDEEQFIEAIGVDLQIIEVGDAFVSGIPLVKVLLGKKGDDLAIMDVRTFESTASVDPAAECTTFICRLRAFVAKKLSGFKRPCPGKLAHGFRPPHGMPHHDMPHDTARPQGGPSRYHHGNHPHAHFSHPTRRPGVLRVLRAIMHVVFPIVVGIFAGVCVGILAMGLISMVLALHVAICGRRSKSSPKADPAEPVVEEGEKAGLMEDQEDHADPPPSYSEETSPKP